MSSALTLPGLTALLLCVVACGLQGGRDCVKATPGAQIDDYLKQEGLEGRETTTSTGLVYLTDELGAGQRANADDAITIHYRGYYADGETFDETDGSPRTFRLANLIPAWKESIPLIQEGGRIKVLAPPALAYGPRPPAGIRCGAILIFDIELLEVATRQ